MAFDKAAHDSKAETFAVIKAAFARRAAEIGFADAHQFLIGHADAVVTY